MSRHIPSKKPAEKTDHRDDWYFRTQAERKAQFTKKEKKRKWREDYLNHVVRGGADR